MAPQGDFQKKIMLIKESPNALEDKTGKMWQGDTGAFLKKSYRQVGIDVVRDCLYINAVMCHGGVPSDHEIGCCRKYVIETIETHRPKVIILHGSAVISSLIAYKQSSSDSSMIKWGGWTIPDRDLKAWVCPTFSPSHVLKNEGTMHALWERDIARAVGKLDDPLPDYPDEQSSVVIDWEPRTVLSMLLKQKKPYLLAFDLETTGLKPYDTSRHEIASISFCFDGEQAYAIPFPKGDKEMKMLRRVLEDPQIGKIAANMKFENLWMKTLHNIQVAPWVFDTMQAAHVLDNRPGITGLKFQSYVRFGTPVYEDEVAPYLRSGSSNEPNQIMKAMQSSFMRDKVLTYNAIDSLLTYRLAQMQMAELGVKA